MGRPKRKARNYSMVVAEALEPMEEGLVKEGDGLEDGEVVEGVNASVAASTSNSGTGPGGSGHGNVDSPPPPSQKGKRTSGSKGKSSSPQVKKQGTGSPPLPSSTQRSTRSASKLNPKLASASAYIVTADAATRLWPGSSADSNHGSALSQPKRSGVTRPPEVLAEIASLSKLIRRMEQRTKKDTREKNSQGEAPGPVDGNATAAKNPSPSPAATTSGTAWTPVLNGRRLGPCELISDLVNEKSAPGLPGEEEEIPWTIISISAELERAPAIREELIQSIFGIWRLKMVDQEGQFDASWQDHLEAWLIRHRDLCFSAGITPFKVAKDYREFVKRFGYLPVDRIPSFTKPEEKVAPEEPVQAFCSKPEPVSNEKETPTQSGNPPEGSPAGRPLTSPYKSDIESLYASPSPKMITDLEPIELESEPDFEMMEQMLLSHRGPHSSQSTKKESSTQPPPPCKTPRPLKRQRSHPSIHGSSQALTQEPQAGVKRPRVQGLRSSNSAAALGDRKKHPEFWDLDGTVVLQVEDVLFRVMRSTLGKASPWFQRLFSGDFEHLEIMAGCPVYLIEEDLGHLDFANLLSGLENGLEYALNPPHYLRIASIFRAASLLEFDTLRKWSLGCLEKVWPVHLPPPSKPSRFGSMIPWAEETLSIANLLEIPQLAKRAYWELCTRPEFGRIDAEAYDNEVEAIMPIRSRLPRSVIMDLTRLRERLLPEWTRITRSPPVHVPCTRAMHAPSTSTSTSQPTPCSLDYASWYRVISEVEVNEMTIDDRRMDLISALEVMIVEIDWEREGGFCRDCVRMWKAIWTKDREKLWKNLGDWLDLGVAS